MTTLLYADIDEQLFEPPQLDCVLHLTGLPNSGSKICDRSPYGNHGTIVGATWVRLPSGLWCLHFDGTDDDVNLGDLSILDFAGNSSFTIMGWWKVAAPTADPSYAPTLISKMNAATNAGWWILAHATNGFQFSLNNNTALAKSAFTGANEWTHFCCIKDSTNPLKQIINGVEPTYTQQDNGVNITAPAGQNCLIGDRSDNPDGAYVVDGPIALVRAINRALTNLEVANIYNREKHLFGVW